MGEQDIEYKKMFDTILVKINDEITEGYSNLISRLNENHGLLIKFTVENAEFLDKSIKENIAQLQHFVYSTESTPINDLKSFLKDQIKEEDDLNSTATPS